MERRITMSKAEKFIQDYTRNCSNEMAFENMDGSKLYHAWLTPLKALCAVEIAREEIYEWLQEHSQEYVYWMDEEFGKDDLINDLKQAMKDE